MCPSDSRVLTWKECTHTEQSTFFSMKSPSYQGSLSSRSRHNSARTLQALQFCSAQLVPCLGNGRLALDQCRISRGQATLSVKRLNATQSLRPLPRQSTNRHRWRTCRTCRSRRDPKKIAPCIWGAIRLHPICIYSLEGGFVMIQL